MRVKLVLLFAFITQLTAGFESRGLNQSITRKHLNKREMPENEVDENGMFVGLFDDECSEPMLITPVKKAATIEPEKSILESSGVACHWTIIGTENCIPVITCKKFKLEPGIEGDEDKCKDEYLEVTDGSFGYDKFCGTDGPQGITNGRMLREFYITLKTSEKSKIKKRELKCQITCSPGKTEGKPLLETSEPEIDDECNCGRKPNSDRIVGGENANRGEFPWMAALVTKNTRKPFCGGTLINNQFVLTAAHCFKGQYVQANDNMEVVLNAHNLDLTSASVAKGEGASADKLTPEQLEAADEYDGSVRFSVDRYFIHPLYVRQTNDFDVALIKLDREIDFKELNYVAPACLPELGSYKESKEGVQAVVSGWGLNYSEATSTVKTLQKLTVNVFKNSECKNFFDERFTRRMMCAGYTEPGHDSCKGDSGGPLISERKKQVWELIGVVSWGEGCAGENSPGVYINTREVGQWIRYISNLENALWCVA